MRSSTSSDVPDTAPRRGPGFGDHGQAAVEFTLAVPVVIVLVLGIVQVLVLGLRQAAIEDLARDAARAASVAADPAAAARAHVDRRVGTQPPDVGVSTSADTVTVTITYPDDTSVPVIGAMIGTIELTATSTMPREPP